MSHCLCIPSAFGPSWSSGLSWCLEQPLALNSVGYHDLPQLRPAKQFVYAEKDYLREHAVITITSLRHPCKNMETFRLVLQERCVVRGRDNDSILRQKAGILAVVTRACDFRLGMAVTPETSLWFEKLPVLR